MESWQGSNLCFVFITIMVVLSAASAAFSRNIVKAAYNLFFTLCGMAAYYVLLGSGFLAVTQVIIYVGGILVLLMFGILLTNRPFESHSSGFRWQYALSLAVSVLVLFFVMFEIIDLANWKLAAEMVQPEPSVRILGHMLLDEYLLALEVAGLVLLISLIGAAYLVRREEH